jgi:hypothetical protein
METMSHASLLLLLSEQVVFLQCFVVRTLDLILARTAQQSTHCQK